MEKHYNTNLFTLNGEGTLDAYYVIVPNDSYIHNCCFPFYMTNDEFDEEYESYCYCELSRTQFTYSSTALLHTCDVCGYEQEHEFTYLKKDNFSHTKQCSLCMYQINEPHNMEIHNTYSICSICRYRINSTNIPIVSIKKEEENE